MFILQVGNSFSSDVTLMVSNPSTKAKIKMPSGSTVGLSVVAWSVGVKLAPFPDLILLGHCIGGRPTLIAVSISDPIMDDSTNSAVETHTS